MTTIASTPACTRCRRPLRTVWRGHDTYGICASCKRCPKCSGNLLQEKPIRVYAPLRLSEDWADDDRADLECLACGLVLTYTQALPYLRDRYPAHLDYKRRVDPGDFAP